MLPLPFGSFCKAREARRLTFYPSEPRSSSSIILHGCQVPRLLHHHNRLLPRTNCSYLRRLLDCPLPTYWWKGSSDRGMLFPKKVDCSPIQKACLFSIFASSRLRFLVKHSMCHRHFGMRSRHNSSTAHLPLEFPPFFPARASHHGFERIEDGIHSTKNFL